MHKFLPANSKLFWVTLGAYRYAYEMKHWWNPLSKTKTDRRIYRTIVVPAVSADSPEDACRIVYNSLMFAIGLKLQVMSNTVRSDEFIDTERFVAYDHAPTLDELAPSHFDNEKCAKFYF